MKNSTKNEQKLLKVENETLGVHYTTKKNCNLLDAIYFQKEYTKDKDYKFDEKHYSNQMKRWHLKLNAHNLKEDDLTHSNNEIKSQTMIETSLKLKLNLYYKTKGNKYISINNRKNGIHLMMIRDNEGHYYKPLIFEKTKGGMKIDGVSYNEEDPVEKGFFDLLLTTYDNYYDNYEKLPLTPIIIAAEKKIASIFESIKNRPLEEIISILENFVLPSEKQINSMIVYFNDTDPNNKIVMTALLDNLFKMEVLKTEVPLSDVPCNSGSKIRGGAALADVKNASQNRAASASILQKAMRNIRNRKATTSGTSSQPIGTSSQLTDTIMISPTDDQKLPPDDQICDTNFECVLQDPVDSPIKRILNYVGNNYTKLIKLMMMLSLITSFMTISFSTNYIGVLSMINVDTIFTTTPQFVQENKFKIINTTVSGLCENDNTELLYNPKTNSVTYSCRHPNEYMEKLFCKTISDPQFLLTNSVIEDLNLNITAPKQLTYGTEPLDSLQAVINSYNLTTTNNTHPTKIKFNMPYQKKGYLEKAIAWMFNKSVEIKLNDKFFGLLSDVTEKFDENRDQVLRANHVFLLKIRHSLFNYILSESHKDRDNILNEFESLSDQKQHDVLLENKLHSILHNVAIGNVPQVKKLVLSNFGGKYFDMYQSGSKFFAIKDIPKSEEGSALYKDISITDKITTETDKKVAKSLSKQVLDDMWLQLKFNIAIAFDDIYVSGCDDAIPINFGNVIANALANSYLMYAPKLPDPPNQQQGIHSDTTDFFFGENRMLNTLKKAVQFFTNRSNAKLVGVLERMIDNIDSKITNKIKAMNSMNNVLDFSLSTVKNIASSATIQTEFLTQVQNAATKTISTKLEIYATILHLDLTKQILTIVRDINSSSGPVNDKPLDEAAKIMAMLLPYEYIKFMYLPEETSIEADLTKLNGNQTKEAIKHITNSTNNGTKGGTKSISKVQKKGTKSISKVPKGGTKSTPISKVQKNGTKKKKKNV